MDVIEITWMFNIIYKIFLILNYLVIIICLSIINTKTIVYFIVKSCFTFLVVYKMFFFFFHADQIKYLPKASRSIFYLRHLWNSYSDFYIFIFYFSLLCHLGSKFDNCGCNSFYFSGAEYIIKVWQWSHLFKWWVVEYLLLNV